jgi:predicted kinase
MKINDLQNKQQPIIYILIGAPASGKSTWSRSILSKDSSFVVISTDDLIEQYGAEEGLNYSEAWPKYNGKATAVAKQKFASAVSSNSNIIYDQTNMGKKKRQSILSNVQDYYKIAVVFDVDTKELFRRNKERAEKTGKNIPEHVIKDMLGRYEIPTTQEGFDKIIRV